MRQLQSGDARKYGRNYGAYLVLLRSESKNQRGQARVEFREQEILGRAIADTNAFKLPASDPESGRLHPSSDLPR